MKFSEYLKEEQEISLLGQRVVNRGHHVLITPETHNEVWEDDFICVGRKLTSLKGAPNHVAGYFNCKDNNLSSLKYGPKIVGNYYECTRNNLTSLEGAPEKIGNYFTCSVNNLKSLEGAPKEINGHFYCSHNDLTSFKDIHKIIKKMNGQFHTVNNPIMSHVLGFLLIPGIKQVMGGGSWSDILNKYLDQGRKGLIACQNELIEAGLEEFAEI